MKLPPLNALKAFEATARNLSMSRAGDELYVSHAAISHQIKNIEEWFGCDLFKRKGRGIELTRLGRLLFNRVNPIFEELNTSCQIVKKMTSNHTLSVGCIPSIAGRWLIPRIEEFSNKYEGLDLQVLYAQPNDKLVSNNLDVLITYGEDETSNVISTQIFSKTIKPVCSPHYAREYSLDTNEKISQAALLHDETRQNWRDWMVEADSKSNQAITGPVFQDINLLASSLLAGHGIALLPIDLFREEINRGDLIVLSDISINSSKEYFIMTNKQHTEIVSDFLKWFIKVTS